GRDARLRAPPDPAPPRKGRPRCVLANIPRAPRTARTRRPRYRDSRTRRTELPPRRRHANVRRGPGRDADTSARGVNPGRPRPPGAAINARPAPLSTEVGQPYRSGAKPAWRSRTIVPRRPDARSPGPREPPSPPSSRFVRVPPRGALSP